MDLGVPIPTIDSAVSMRQISARKAERVAAAKKLGIVVDELSVDEELRASTIEFVREGLQLAFVITYAQGLSSFAASIEKQYNVDMVEIAKIWLRRLHHPCGVARRYSEGVRDGTRFGKYSTFRRIRTFYPKAAIDAESVRSLRRFSRYRMHVSSGLAQLSEGVCD